MNIFKKLKYIRYRNYNPDWLVEAAEKRKGEYPWLPNALSKCTSALVGSKYIRFVNSSRPNKKGSEWQFQENIWLENTIEGDVVLDILQENRVGGVELYDRLFDD